MPANYAAIPLYTRPVDRDLAVIEDAKSSKMCGSRFFQVQRERMILANVRTLTQREKLPLLRDHLLRLDPASRHDRFNGFLDAGFIERYAARCAADGTVIIGYIENGVVQGAAELHLSDQSSDSLPEVAFSVEASVRRRGVGTILFRRLIAEARCKGYSSLRITTGAKNRAMRALARKFGAQLSFRHGESTGVIDLLLPEAYPAHARP
jgi:GNAT superfamily N-acetyltransferase